MHNSESSLKIKRVNPVDYYSESNFDIFQHSINPLLMPDILHTLFGIIGHPLLLTCRQVSKTWNQMATKKLLEKFLLRIPNNFYTHYRKPKWKNVKKTFFFSTETSQIHKIRNLHIQKPRDIRSFEFLQIFQQGNIEHVTLSVQLNEEMLEKLISFSIPHLKRIDKPKWMFKNQENLIILDRNMIKVCSNLTPNPNSNLIINQLCVDQKEGQHPDAVDLNTLDKFSQCGVKVEKLYLDFTTGGHRASEITLKILIANQKTLKWLTLCHCPEFLGKSLNQNEQFPIFPNLEYLYITVGPTIENQDVHPMKFPVAFTFSHNFPKLKILSLDARNALSISSNCLWTQFLKLNSAGIAQSVVALNCSLEKDRGNIFHNFPSVKSLEVKLFSNFAKILKSIWSQCKQVQQLTIHFNGHLLQSMDSIFTGFPAQLIKTIKCFDEANLNNLLNRSRHFFDSFRTKASIVQLDKLEQLCLWLGPIYDSDVDFLLSWVSAEFAFNLMPHLHIRIYIYKWVIEQPRIQEAFQRLLRNPNIQLFARDDLQQVN